MIRRIKYLYFRAAGARLMRRYYQVVEQLTPNFDISMAEKICPIIIEYRKKAMEYCVKLNRIRL